jgi:DNA-binding response OmpR family regulator
MERMKPITIAYVEDDPVVRAAYQNRLVKHGFHVEIAPDGLLAMKLFATLTPDLVILDLMLPKFNGVEVFKFIRSKSHLRTVPVIILSTNSIIDAEEEHILEQASKRLIKEHCTFSTILAAIEELLPAAVPQENAVFSGSLFPASATVSGILAPA